MTVAEPDPVFLWSAANRRRFEHWSFVPEGHGDGPFPLVLLLHGVYDATGAGWWRHARAHEQVQRLADGGLAPPVVLLMACDTGAEQGSGWCDWADGTTFAETHVLGELLPWAEANLPVAGAPRHVTGLSMGGYGSLLLALRHPGTFASATSTSGFYDPLRLFDFVEPSAERMWGSDDGLVAHDVRRLVEEPSRRAGLRMAFDCGTGDALVGEGHRLHEQLSRLGVRHSWAEHPGGHDWTYWADHLGDHIRFHTSAGGVLQELER